jgi:hypothetical protein
MRTTRTLLLLLLSAFAGVGAANTTSPYVGQDSREIKALSASEVADLLAGRGMGLARAAELNGYPGPMHVLELNKQLGLTEAQSAATKALFARMQASAKELGAELVAGERALDALFRERRATREALEAELARVASLQSRVRGVHLQAHIEQTRILSPQQVARYMQLRGYGSDKASEHQRRNHKH